MTAPTPVESAVYNLTQAAQVMGVSPATVSRMIHDPACDIPVRWIRTKPKFPKRRLLLWIEDVESRR